MKLVGWASMAAALIAGTAIAQFEDEGTGKAKVEVPADMPQSHVVKEGDTLWDITQTYYGDPYQWPRVWSYNPEITNPHWIYPDATVRLRPGDDEVIKTAPRGYRRTKRMTPSTHAVYQAEYGFLDGDALKDAGYIIAANEEHMMMADTDQVYARFNEDFKPEVGRVYTVFRTMREGEREVSERSAIFRAMTKSEREEPEQGTLVRIIGEVRLGDYDTARQIGRAEIINTLDPIERGFRLAPLERKFYWVDAVPAAESLRATIVASLYPRKLPSTDQIVFVNVGAEQGVVLGNRFYVVRQGDEWRRSAEGKVGREIEVAVPLPDPPEHYPWEVVAIGRAVNVQPRTTAILLEHANRAVRMGDRAELRKGE
ncbi:MAG: LysM peptidoglycan-binding domain-containing protein [Polyangiales bacterium]